MKIFLSALVLVMLLSACQPQPGSTPVPGTAAPTATPTLPTAETALPPATAAPLPSPSTTPSPTAALTARAEDLKGITLLVKHPLAGAQAQVFEQLIDDFNRQNIWGIRAQSSPLYGLTALDEQLAADLDKADLPNLILASPALIASWQAELNIVINLAPFIEHHLWGLSAAEYADIPLAYWGQEDDHRTVPLLRTAAVLFYNQSWARELGFNAPPTTPLAFREQACAASLAYLNDADLENNGLGGWFLERDALTLLAWLQAFDAPTFNSAAPRLQFGTPAAAETFTYLRRLLDSACAWTSKTTTVGLAFSQRQALFYSGALEDVLVQERVQAVQKNTDQWVMLPYPSSNGQAALTTDGIDGAVFLAPAAEQLASWLLLRHILLPRSQAALASAGGSLPVRTSALDLMAEFARQHPQWAQLTRQPAGISAAPQTAQWRIARRVLEDAAWQIFQPYVTPARIPELLALVDTTLEELEKRQP